MSAVEFVLGIAAIGSLLMWVLAVTDHKLARGIPPDPRTTAREFSRHEQTAMTLANGDQS